MRNLACRFLLSLFALLLACGTPEPGSPSAPTATEPPDDSVQTTLTTLPPTTTTLRTTTTTAPYVRTDWEINFLVTLEDWIERSGGFNFMAEWSDYDKIRLGHDVCALTSWESSAMPIKEAIEERYGRASRDLIHNVIILAVENFCPDEAWLLETIYCLYHPGQPHVIGGPNNDHCSDDFQTYGTGE